jgi:hypothetical protein
MACRAASGIQPGDEVRAIRRGQLTREEGEVPSKVKPVGTHRGGGASTGRRGHLRTAAPVAASGGRGVVLRQGAVAREAAGGASEGSRRGALAPTGGDSPGARMSTQRQAAPGH